MRIIKKVFLALIFSSFISMFLPVVFANDTWHLPDRENTLRGVKSDFHEPDTDLEWTDQLKNVFIDKLIPLTKYIIVSISILFMILAIFKVIVSWWEEEKITDFKKKMSYALIWFIIIWVSEYVGQIFDPTASWNTKDFWDIEWMRNLFISVWSYVKVLAWWFAVLMIVASWFKMIASEWDDSKTSEIKKWIIYSFVWIIVILTSERFILDIFFKDYWVNWPNNEAAVQASTEIMWIVALLMQYLSIFWVVFLVLAWIYYIFSMWDDDATSKAKTIMKNVWIWLIVLIVSYTLIATFIPS